MNNKICVVIKIINSNKFLICWPDDPSSDSNRCPAIIFAVNRIDNVIGRIIKLINSIITINGIKIGGVFDGVKWVNILFVKFIHPKIIILNQILKENDKQNLICLDDVKIYGKRPIKLL